MEEFSDMLRIGMSVQFDIDGFKKVERVESVVDPQKRREAMAAFIGDVCRLPVDKATNDEIEKVFAFAKEAYRLRAEIATREYRKRFGITLSCDETL